MMHMLKRKTYGAANIWEENCVTMLGSLSPGGLWYNDPPPHTPGPYIFIFFARRAQLALHPTGSRLSSRRDYYFCRARLCFFRPATCWRIKVRPCWHVSSVCQEYIFWWFAGGLVINSALCQSHFSMAGDSLVCELNTYLLLLSSYASWLWQWNVQRGVIW